MNSIRLRLFAWLVGPILLFNFAVAALTYLLAWTPAQRAFDQGLQARAAALAVDVRAGVDLAALALPGDPEDPETLWFSVRDEAGRRLLAGNVDLATMAGSGVRDGTMGDQPVRIASRAAVHEGIGVTVTVATTLRQRQQVRASIVRALVLLEVAFTLALAGLAWFSISNGLAPLARLRSALNRRERADLAPLDPSATPSELAAVVLAFNGLLARLAAAARSQDAFLADMAHQLRNPLAGAKLQLEWLAARHQGDPESVRALALMKQANERMIRQTSQLLALARAEPGRSVRARFKPLDLAALVAESVQLFVTQAASHGIDLGFELDPAPLRGEHFLLRDLIDNLVDNALRYTPAGGSVTVRTSMGPDGAILEVEDSGPGIPAPQRATVFQRHVRLDQQTSGSGLGLAIVRDIARVHGAKAEVGSAHGESGVLFTVKFKI
ncbi:MAG: sensor histidine kinase [Pseudomonadota bacterium]|nr:sensor histidine kinase [Pseudomonadota bacterium]